MADLVAQMVLTADASGVEAGVGSAKRSLADLGVTAAKEGKKAADGVAAIGEGSQQAAAKVDANAKNLINSIQRATAAAEAGKKSGSEFYAALANQRGVSTEVLKPYLAQLDQALAKQKAVQQVMDATAPSLDRVGMSAKATAAAMRGVPAQFTDIVTSLQGGQAPLTVLLQQGGQLKDMFGGIGPAASALGSYVGGMATPLTLAAAAVGVLAFAFYQGTERMHEFSKALIASGNYAGKTAGDLDELSRKISATVGTQGQATDALVALAATGKVSGDVLEAVARAVVAQNKAMGTSVKDAVEEYVRLGEEPTKASAKLNESLHYLNLATFERIRALEDEGRKEEAAALAQFARAESAVANMQKVRSEAGLMARALGLTRDVAMGMWNAIANGVGSIGAQQSAAERLAAAQQRLAYIQTNSGSRPDPKALAAAQADVVSASRAAIREQENAASEGERARTRAAQIAASQRLEEQRLATRTPAERRKDEIEQLDRDAKTVGLKKEEYDRRLSDINEKYKDKKGAAPKAYQDDAATKMLETLRQTEASLRAQLDGESKLTEAQKKQVEFQQLIADLKGKKILTAEQQSLLANRDAISAQLEKNAGLSNQIEFEKKIEELTKKSAENAKQFRQQMDALNVSMASGQLSRNEQADRSLGAFGLGDRARQEVEAQKAIRAEFKRYQDTADRDAGKLDMLESDGYRKEVEKIKKALDDALAAQTAYFDALKSKQADWKNGATTALANYVDALNNAAATTERAFTDGFKSAEDALVQFVTTGKLSFTGLANSVIADLARIAIQQSITKPLAQGLLGILNGGGFGGGAVSGDADYLKQIGLSGNSGLSITGGSGGALFEGIGKWLSGIKFFADGGSPPVGQASVVGERGPELFIPSVSGTIIPNHALGGAAPVTVVNHWNVGDIPTMSMLRNAIAGSEQRIAAGLRRSRDYGGAAA